MNRIHLSLTLVSLTIAYLLPVPAVGQCRVGCEPYDEPITCIHGGWYGGGYLLQPSAWLGGNRSYTYESSFEQNGCSHAMHQLLADINSAWIYFPNFGIGDISLFTGGPFPPHMYHQNGLEVDMRYIRLDGQNQPCDLTPDQGSPCPYDIVTTQFLINTISDEGFSRLVKIIVSPDAFLQPFAFELEEDDTGGHDNHFHVRMVK